MLDQLTDTFLSLPLCFSLSLICINIGILPTGPPEAVTNCTVKNQSFASSLVVTCVPGESGGLKQSFFMEVYDTIDGSLHGNISSLESPRFILSHLKPESKFNLHVFSTNSKGRSAVTVLTAPLITQSEKQTHCKCFLLHVNSLSFIFFLSFFTHFLLFPHSYSSSHIFICLRIFLLSLCDRDVFCSV